MEQGPSWEADVHSAVDCGILGCDVMCSEEGGDTILQNFGNNIEDHTASQYADNNQLITPVRTSSHSEGQEILHSYSCISSNVLYSTQHYT